jgi:Double zinc ribbon
VTPSVELVLGIVLAAAAVYFVLRPVLNPTPQQAAAGAAEAAEEIEDLEDDLSARTVALRALKEIEFDRATGKLADQDYESLKQQYTAVALDALREDETPRPPRAAGAAAPPVAKSALACPTHGPRPERDATYCSECGRKLPNASGYCARCGTALPPGARFCARCGMSVAA